MLSTFHEPCLLFVGCSFFFWTCLDLKNMEYNLPPIIHMYRPFLMVVHLRSSLIFGSSKKSVCHFVFGLLTQISGYQP